MDSFSKLKPTIEALKSACDAQDQVKTEQLDQELRRQVAEMVAQAKDESSKAELQVTLTKVNKMLGLLENGVESKRQVLGEELAKVTREQKAASAYQQSQKY